MSDVVQKHQKHGGRTRIGDLTRWARRFHILERFSSSMLIIPVCFAIGGFLLEDLMLWLGRTFEPPESLLLDGGAATSVLSTIVGAMMSVTGIVFSVLTLTVQYAGGAVSPRVVRTFYRDKVVKLALGCFVGTFSYSLLLIPNANDADSGLAVIVGVVLSIVSLLVFLVLVNHVGQSLRPAAMIRRVGDATLDAIDEVHPRPLDQATVGAGAMRAENGRVITYQGSPGVIMGANFAGLSTVAENTGGTIVMLQAIGDFITPGAPIFRVDGIDESVEVVLNGSVAVGEERTISQDPAFGIRILVDAAAKALSPGVNDPTTAVVAIDQIHAVLNVVIARDLDIGRTSGSPGAFGAVGPTWSGYLDLALLEVEFYGADSFQVTRRVAALLDDLEAASPAGREQPIQRHREILRERVEAALSLLDDGTYALTPDRQGIGTAQNYDRL